MGLAHSPKIVTNGLTLCLDAGNTKSYPGSGTLWYDLSGNKINGTLTNSPTANTEVGGNLGFAAASSQYVTLGTPSLLNGVQVPLTITGWARLNSTGTRTLWGVYSATSAGKIYSLLRIDTSTLKYYASTAAGGYQSQGTFTPALNTWNFYAVVVSGSIATPTVTIYLNKTSQSFSYAAFTSTPDLTVDFRIGGNQSAFSEYWNGNISNVSWYNRALSAEEILQNYNALRGRFNV